MDPEVGGSSPPNRTTAFISQITTLFGRCIIRRDAGDPAPICFMTICRMPKGAKGGAMPQGGCFILQIFGVYEKETSRWLKG